MIIIDGSTYEGGGSILRLAVPIAAAKSIPIKIVKIRAKRKTPGLKLQHLLGIKALADITGATVNGLFIGSTELTFIPGKIQLEHHFIKIDTAASITLIIQLIHNFVCSNGKSISLEFLGGGTHTQWAPIIEYTEQVTSVILEKFGISTDITVDRVGFYPKGGGIVKVRIFKQPNIMDPIIIQKISSSTSIQTISITSSKLETARVAERQYDGFSKSISQSFEIQHENKYHDVEAGTTFFAKVNGDIPVAASKIGQVKVSAERVGNEVAKLITEYLKHEIMDPYLSDQVILPLAFAPIGSKVKIHITDHVKSNLYVIERLLGKVFKLEYIEHYLIIEKC
jgi:RNA 3'-phosphate cyclase